MTHAFPQARPVDVIRALSPEERHERFRVEVLEGLRSSPKQLEPKWFYDDHGSELFDRITRLDEYYLTRVERSILQARAREIADATGAQTVVELGAGTSDKTRELLDVLRPAQLVTFDVSEETLMASAAALNREYPWLTVTAIVGDFERHLRVVPSLPQRMLLFLGSTIGNLEPARRAAFLDAVAGTLHPGEHFLLGIDLVKDASRLQAAYDDQAGVTASFNLNVLQVLNRELGADFDLSRFGHRARWNSKQEWMQMSVRSLEEQTVHLTHLGATVRFQAGEEMQTEISAKFRRDGIEQELRAAGLRLQHWWTDDAADFAVLLATPSESR